MKNRSVLVTGATGFVGRQVCASLQAAGFKVGAAVRRPAALPEANHQVVAGDIGSDTVWQEALAGVEAVVHLASHAPRAGAGEAETAAAYHEINVAGTERLARAALAAGVRRLLYLSTIKVNGESTPHGAFAETDTPMPRDIYGQSKLEAERLLLSLAARSNLEVVILRSPLVYGPGVKGNFLSLLKVVERGVPLPLKRVANRRSMLYVLNLADAIKACLAAPAARGQTYVLSDGEDISTADLLRHIAVHMGRGARLWPVPVGVLRGLGKLLGKSAVIERLTGSLLVNSGKIRQQLGWTPPFTVDEGLKATVEWYLAQRDDRA